nr:DUF4365 domain-containing protein [Enterococcus raffinosus]
MSKYGSVNEYNNDYGFDFSCAIISNNSYTGQEFYAQCKGTEKIAEDKDFVSLQLKTSTVRLWFKKRYLTFLFYVDLDKEDIYWVAPFEQLSEKIKSIADNQKTIVIRVPKSNLLDRKEERLPVAFLKSMETFDKYLLNGTLLKINEDLALFTENDLFSEELTINEDELEIIIDYRNVRLVAAYPKHNLFSNKGQGNCLIQFSRHLKKAENDLTFTHEQILTILSSGKETDFRLGMRKYVGLYLERYNQYFADFGNSRIYLYPHEVSDLCKVMDVFIPKYIAKITDFMKRIDARSFEPYGHSHMSYKFMQLDVPVWEAIRDYVQTYQTDYGKYEDGYVFTPVSDINYIGIDDEKGRQLCEVRGHYTQSKYNSENLVVDVVWRCLDSSNYGGANPTYTVSETYSYFINKLLPKFLVNATVTTKKSFFRSKKELVYHPKTKIEIERMVGVRNYKLPMSSSDRSEISNVFFQLSEFLKNMKFYPIKSEALRNLMSQFDHIVREQLSSCSDYSKQWYRTTREDLFKSIAKIEQENQEASDGYFLAYIFRKFQSIICEFPEAFGRGKLSELEILHDFSQVIADYNEHKLIELLTN